MTGSVPILVAAVKLGSPRYNDGQFQFAVSGATNYEYVVQRSDDLTAWFPVVSQRGPFLFTDATTTEPGRFYRVRLQP